MSQDGTVRYLIAFDDGQSVETVWMPEGDGGEAGEGSKRRFRGRALRRGDWGRATICISSQVGCAVDCQFCLTALLGVKRNLTAGEIVGQVCAVLKDQKVSPQHDRINLVFMGMGEPFLNYENFMKAVRCWCRKWDLAESTDDGFDGRNRSAHLLISGRRRSGLGWRFLSTRRTTICGRSLMPLNKKWNLERLMAAAREFPLRNRERVTFEYVLLQ